ncbi:YxiJ family protein [Paenisporosarcina sp. TG20]|uniref:YxiJ family protein n=1 Tax=Paenisporosarcina sp. TG20 TaxID=1211706 RepID=UPI0002E9DBAE|nr:YxiJ family protein [Paenisporosarcina sp. TG20]
MKKGLISELENLYNIELMNEFPNEDIEKIEKDFEDIISEVDWLVGDFNEFCMLIAGSSSYVLGNKKIPNNHRQVLYKNFYSLYPKYSILKDSISNYPHFYKELESFEKARELLLVIIQNNT